MKKNFLRRFMLMSLMAMLCSLTATADTYPSINTSALSSWDQNAPIGFGAGVTGSEDENPVTVTTLSELQSALSGTDKKTIYVSGTIEFTGSVGFSNVQNKTIYGLPGSKLSNTTHSTEKNASGIMRFSNCSNIIMRNLTFLGAGAYDIDGNDNLTMSNCTNIWVDHCDFQDGVDGNFDCNNGSDNICVSWCRFRYLISPWSGGSGGSNDHRFSNLWGGGDGNASVDEGKLNTTFYACWWDEGCRERMPRIRFGQVHILNCLYSSSVANYCVGTGYKSNVYVEKSAFTSTKTQDNPWKNCATSSGYTDYNIQLTGCSGASDATNSSGSNTQFVPSYSYTPMAASSVEAAVSSSTNGAGATLTFVADETLFSWEGGTATGGSVAASNNADASDTELEKDIKNSYIRLRGANDFSTAVVTVTFNTALKAGDKIKVTAYRNKNATGKQSGFKAQFNVGSSTVGSSTGLEFVNINAAVSESDEYSTTPNTCVFEVPADADGSTTMTMTRSHTSTNLFISKLEVTTTAEDSPYPITAKWDFQNLTPATMADVNIQGTTEQDVASDVDGISMHVISNGGKLQYNADGYAQFNTNTTIQVPVQTTSDVVTVVSYPGQSNYTVGGEDATGNNTFNHTATAAEVTAGYVEIVPSKTAYIYSIQVVQNDPNGSDDPVVPASSYTNTWQFGKGNGAPEFALQKSAEYEYTVSGHTLVINTDAGKLNNASRTDQWAQCNNGTTFKIPVYAGAKVSWGRYTSGSEAGFTVGGTLYNDYYIATENGTLSISAYGVSYLSYIKVEPVTMYEISGTVSGGSVDGASMQLTADGNGETYSATIASSAFTMSVPADTYTPSLSNDVAFVVSSPASVTVSAAGSIGAITIEAAQPQTVSGQITNAPAEGFTLTFTATNDTEHTANVVLAANATSYNVTLDPDTYTISSSVGTLSTLSQESFQVLLSAVTHNIYYPEAAVPAATQQNITVDNTATVSANVYNTVTDALAAAKAGSISSPVITLTSGQTYREQVIVDLANVTLKTSGAEKATITWYYGIGYAYYSLNASGYYDKDRAMTRNDIKMIDPSRWGATVLVKNTGAGFKAENIIFENSFNQYYTDEEVTDGVTPNGVQSISYDRTLTSGESGYKAADAKDVTERAAAIAFENNPTGCQLYNCSFIGSQDTFYSSGTLYVKNCSITGNTDYIFGGGYVVFDDCDLVIGGYSDKETSAYITAYYDGSTLTDGKEYVFRDCTVKAGNRTYVKANLGRDWGGAAASVYFFNLKNEIGSKLSYTWNNMGGGVSAGTANLHIYDFDSSINANYSTTGTNGANINGVLTDANATTLYTRVVSQLGFTPEQVYDITLDENIVYNSLRIAAANGGTGDVTLNRNISAGKWSTVVLPFDMNATQMAAAFGENAKVAQLTSYSDDVLHFSTVTSMNANEPYLVKTDAAVTSATIENATLASATPSKTVDGMNFVGSYAASTNIPYSDGSNTYYFISDNKLYSTAASGDYNTIKGFRAYFKVPVTSSARNLMFDVDGGETTGINEELRMKNEESVYYNIAGQRVAQPTKGLYILNGRKVIIK